MRRLERLQRATISLGIVGLFGAHPGACFGYIAVPAGWCVQAAEERKEAAVQARLARCGTCEAPERCNAVADPPVCQKADAKHGEGCMKVETVAALDAKWEFPCAKGLYCAPDDRCGDGRDGDACGGGECEKGLICHEAFPIAKSWGPVSAVPHAFKCKPPSKRGQPCMTASDCIGDPKLACRGRASPSSHDAGRCESPAKLGEPCVSHLDCAETDECQPSEDDVNKGTCVHR